ncbi:cyanoexosortase A system-associated protein [Crocosphaera sp.]|uniref:cyanoexosortase A system-associated protein n=1 Tax=Crocosphaera sp. TaxID=2729996 RepID=UPI003F28E692|nr:cyanoexosortase A system-associated protein [Crocosphaera sp.]
MNVLQPHWQKTRVSLLGVLLLGILGFLTYQILVPQDSTKNKNTQTVTIPDTVPLPNWKLIKSQPLQSAEGQDEVESFPGKVYEYSNDQERLQAEIRYAKYSGSFNHFLIRDMGMPAATIYPNIYYKKGVGHYAVFEYENTSYLGSCINPKGESTVTLSQYNKNRYLRGWGLTRTFFWLMGEQDLVEYRCLWTIISMPNPSELDFSINIDPDKKELNEVEKQLEETWFNWYSWWKNNFPDY